FGPVFPGSNPGRVVSMEEEANPMKVELTYPAWIAITTLKVDDRRDVEAWLDHLKNWENDEIARANSKRLAGEEPLYLLKTNTDLRLFFEVRGDEITVLDVARQDTIDMFARTAAQGQE